MLLEYIVSRSEIEMTNNAFDNSVLNNPELYFDVKDSETIIIEIISKKYGDISESDLNEIVHFGVISWSFLELDDVNIREFCNNCGYCCTECSPLRIHAQEYLNYSEIHYSKIT